MNAIWEYHYHSTIRPFLTFIPYLPWIDQSGFSRQRNSTVLTSMSKTLKSSAFSHWRWYYTVNIHKNRNSQNKTKQEAFELTQKMGHRIRHGNSPLAECRQVVGLFWTKYAVPRQMQLEILKLTIGRGQSNFNIAFIFVSFEQKGYCHVVSVGQLNFWPPLVLEPNAMQNGTARHGTTRHGTTRQNTVQYSITQYFIVHCANFDFLIGWFVPRNTVLWRNNLLDVIIMVQ